MAHIVSLEVEGLVGRESKFALQLHRDLNIFFGPNGSGKTSLLKLLHSAMSDDASILATVPFERATVEFYSVHADQIFTRTIALGSASLDARDYLTFYGGVEEPGELWVRHGAMRQRQAKSRLKEAAWSTKPKSKATGYAHRYLPTSRLYQTARSPAHYAQFAEPVSEEWLDRYFADSIFQLWTSYTASLFSAIRKAQDDGLASILRAVLGGADRVQGPDAIDTSTTYDRVRRFLGRQRSVEALPELAEFENRYGLDPQLRRVVNDINSIEERIEAVMEPRKELESLVRSMFTGGKTVEFTDQTIEIKTKRGQPLGLASLSSGEKQLIRLLIESLLADVNSIIIDEPEISMHIDWQRILVKSMMVLSPQSQIIMATHSPEIMSEVPDRYIFSL